MSTIIAEIETFPGVSFIQNLVQYQPVSAQVNMNSCFTSYRSGVLREQDCSCAKRDSYN